MKVKVIAQEGKVTVKEAISKMPPIEDVPNFNKDVTVYVMTPEDFYKDEDNKEMIGMSAVKDREIFITTNTPKFVTLHEMKHIALGTKRARNPRSYVEDELECDLYTVQKTGHPKGKKVRGHLNAIFHKLQEEYKLTPLQAIDVMEKALNKYPSLPDEWRDIVRRGKSKIRRKLG